MAGSTGVYAISVSQLRGRLRYVAPALGMGEMDSLEEAGEALLV